MNQPDHLYFPTFKFVSAVQIKVLFPDNERVRACVRACVPVCVSACVYARETEEERQRDDGWSKKPFQSRKWWRELFICREVTPGIICTVALFLQSQLLTPPDRASAQASRFTRACVCL